MGNCKEGKKAEAHRFCGLGMHFCARQHWDTENAGRARALVVLAHLHFTAPVALSQMEMQSYGLLSRSGSQDRASTGYHVKRKPLFQPLGGTCEFVPLGAVTRR